MDNEFIAKVVAFEELAEEILTYAPRDEEEFDKLEKGWQEFFEECANVVNAYNNLPRKENKDS